MKKILTILLAVMVVVGFTACNQVQPGHQIGARNAVVNVAADAETSDPEHYAMKINAEKASISVASDNVITISANEAELTKCLSDNEDQRGTGDEKFYWIGVLIDTNLDTIVGAKLDNTPLTNDDATEAKGVGGNSDEFVLWVKADEGLKASDSAYPRVFKLSDKDGNFITTFTVVLDIEPAPAE